MRRLFGLITALAVSFFAMMPVSAWDKYSFVGDSVYSVRPNSDLQSVPSVHAPTDTSASGADFLNLFMIMAMARVILVLIPLLLILSKI